MNQKGNILIVVALVSVLAGGAVLYLKSYQWFRRPLPTQQTSTSSAAGTKTFISKDLKFTLNIPNSFQIKSSSTGLTLISPDGSIEIIRNGTQFPNLVSYLDEFDSKRSIKTDLSENLIISGYKSIKRVERRSVGGETKNPEVYYIYVDSYVYILSTDNKVLYDDLDQIAQSFRYTP